MAVDLQHPPAEQQSVTGLVAGIIDDFQKLLTQQMDMARAEVRTDWNRIKEALVPLTVGGGLLAIGGLLLSLTLVFLLHWGTTPASAADPAQVPLWGCFAIIGALFLALGGGCLAAGIHKLQTVTPLPEQSAEALKENVKWLTNSK